MGVADSLPFEPLIEIREVLSDLLSVEDSVDHVAAEQSDFDLVPQVGVDLLVLVDALEDVGGRRPIRELQLIELLLGDCSGVPLLEVLDRHVLDDSL